MSHAMATRKNQLEARSEPKTSCISGPFAFLAHTNALFSSDVELRRDPERESAEYEKPIRESPNRGE